MKTNKSSLKRVIVDYKKLDENILALLIKKFPFGYDDSDIITFRSPNAEVIEAVEVRTEDTIYLVKISKRLVDRMDSFELIEEDEKQEDGKNLREEEDLEIPSDEDIENDIDKNL